MKAHSKVQSSQQAAQNNNNEHLAMYHDTQSAVYVSKLAAEKLYPNVVVTTPLAIGVSEHWMDHKGTLTLRPEVFERYCTT